MTGPFGPERTPTQTLNAAWTRLGAPHFARLWGTVYYLTHPHLRNPTSLFDNAVV